MMESYDSLFERDIRRAVKTGAKLLREFPQSRSALARVLTRLPKAARKRAAHQKRGVAVPPLLIVSTTESCNLRCTGCYAQAQGREPKPEMTKSQIDGLLSQAVDAGCSVILLAGGEPLLRMEWLKAVASRPELLGLVFTNGTLMDDAMASWFGGYRNLLPLFSVEGDERTTDARRGNGVAARVERAMELLYARKIPFGLSITAGEHNIDGVAREGFLQPFQELGCRLAIYSEYVPMDDGGALLALTEESKKRLQSFCRDEKSDMLRLVFPGDETAFGGCLAAGRGFAHISASGELEPCPFAAYSDRNVLKTPLVDALASPLFQRIRDESHLLHEGAGGCALRGKAYLCGGSIPMLNKTQDMKEAGS